LHIFAKIGGAVQLLWRGIRREDGTGAAPATGGAGEADEIERCGSRQRGCESNQERERGIKIESRVGAAEAWRSACTNAQSPPLAHTKQCAWKMVSDGLLLTTLKLLDNNLDVKEVLYAYYI
jgi:hypothetical protein